jgi:hypothetical protein
VHFKTAAFNSFNVKICANGISLQDAWAGRLGGKAITCCRGGKARKSGAESAAPAA